MSPPTTPERALKHREADTVKKSRFFEAVDARTRESISFVAAQHGISE